MTITHPIIAPAPAQSAIEAAIQIEQRRYWRVEAEARAALGIENIRFAHDPQWREAWFSIQGIRDAVDGKAIVVTPRVMFWRLVAALYWFGGIAFSGGGIVLLGRGGLTAQLSAAIVPLIVMVLARKARDSSSCPAKAGHPRLCGWQQRRGWPGQARP